MTVREWVVEQITAEHDLMAQLPGGLHQASSVEQRENPPYVTYRFGLSSPIFRDDEAAVVIRQDMVFWVYDVPGDFQRIDGIIKELMDILTTAVGIPGSHIVRARWVGNSDDIVDLELNRIQKNSRFELYYTRGAA